MSFDAQLSLAAAAAAIAAVGVPAIWRCGVVDRRRAANVTVFAAASLKEALDEQAKRFAARNGDKVVIGYAASNALARQIEAGAGADIFVSADQDWMNYLDERKLIAPGRASTCFATRWCSIAPRQQVDAQDRAEVRPGRRARPRKTGDGQSGQRTGGKVRQERAGEPSACGAPSRPRLRGPTTCARRSRSSPAARRRSASSTRPSARRQGRTHRRHVSDRYVPADRLSRRDRGGEPVAGGAAAAEYLRSAFRARRLAEARIRDCAVAHDGNYAG